MQEMAAMGNSTDTGTKLDAGDVRCDVVVIIGNWLDMSREHRLKVVVGFLLSSLSNEQDQGVLMSM